jgi:Capsule assembly protein Wzi
VERPLKGASLNKRAPVARSIKVAIALSIAATHTAGYARGVTPYLPLNLDPEVEREVERVLVLGDKPVITRPIPAAMVLDALPKACKADPNLCDRVTRYLKNYMHSQGLEFASVEADYTHGSNLVTPNQHGRTEQNHYQVAGAGYLQPSDYLLVNVGGVAYEGRVTPTGSLVSLGFDWAQLDVGWRDHWWSPMTDSSMLLSTEAPTMPSITLSNYEPLTRLGIHYEIMLARMSKSSKIELPVTGQLTTGYPKVAGLHLAFEPVPGWAISANRILIFGGGAAGGQSIGNIFQAFFNPSKAQSSGFGTSHVVGKQEASVASRFIFPGPVPFAVYFEYAGNDTDAGRNYLFGKPDLSMGVHFPRIGPFDVTFENSYWAPTWYVHGYSNVQTGYGDGITNDGDSFGMWFGDQRVFGYPVGGRSDMLRVGWEPSSGGRWEATLRMLVNDNYGAAGPGAGYGGGVAFYHEYMGALSYSYPWKDYVVGGEIDQGRDVFGHAYTRLAAFLRYGDALHGSSESAGDEALGVERPDGAELFVDAGANASRVNIDLNGLLPRYTPHIEVAPHVGFGARRAVSQHQDLGVRIEADEINHRAFYNFRLLDYRWRFRNPLALELFGGAARYNLTTPAYGFTFGAGAQWRNILPGWDLGLDYLYGIKVARLRLLPNELQTPTRPDSFYDIDRVSLYLSRKF